MTTWLDDVRSGHRVPVVQAPMAGASDARLAAAVSAAGALGTVAFAYGATPEDVATVSRAAGEGGPFGIGLMAWQLGESPEVLDAAVARGPALLSISFGDPTPWVGRARALDPGIQLTCQVGTRDEALRALDAGVDLLVARGSEGGGHGRGGVSTLVLLQEVLDLAGKVPVLAAGGIATARGMAAVLAAGALGAWVGTPFAACAESPFAEAYRAAMIAAGSDGTTYTRVFDVAQRLDWPEVYGGRALRNATTERWDGRVGELVETIAAGDPDGVTEGVRAARAAADPQVAPVYAGQSVGLLVGHRTAAEVVAELGRGRVLLREAAARLPGAGTA